VWIRVSGALDIASSPQFEPALHEALQSALLVVLDVRALTFLDSAGVCVLIAADAQARRSRRRLVLVHAHAPIDRLLELTGASEQLEIVDLRPILASAQSQYASAGPDDRTVDV
jgi:anti-sigma B factor antagonist